MVNRLPEYPVKGNRRELDQAWLEALHRYGIDRFLKENPQPPEGLTMAVEEFNQGQYWKCHETLEGVWLPERYPLRLFYHGLIKSAVGLLHMQRRNVRGGKVKLDDAQYALYPFQPQFMGIDTARLSEDIKARLAYARDTDQIDWETVENLPAVQIYLAS